MTSISDVPPPPARQRVAIAGLALLAATFLAGCKAEQPKAARQDTAVRLVTAHYAPYAPMISLTGEVRARTSSDLSFKVGGRIIERTVNVGDHVAKGQVLARLDPTQQQADAAAAEATLAAAEAQARQSAATFQRQKALLDKGFTTRSDFDRAQQQSQTADNAVESARAALEIARNALGDTDLKADEAGTITARNADIGEVVPAARTIFTLAVEGPRDAIFNVDEALLLGKFESPVVDLQMVGNPAIRAKGRFREAAPSINPQTGTIRVKFGIEFPSKEIEAAMTLGALVIGSNRFEPQIAVSLPATAIAGIDGKPAVWVVDPTANTVMLKPVEILAYETSAIKVRSGLSEGDRVVVEGGKFLVSGQKVSELKGAGA
jgi:RND family efflux transporter MFP subunit